MRRGRERVKEEHNKEGHQHGSAGKHAHRVPDYTGSGRCVWLCLGLCVWLWGGGGGLWVGLCVGLCMGLCVGLCMGLCGGLCMGLCMGLWGGLCGGPCVAIPFDIIAPGTSAHSSSPRHLCSRQTLSCRMEQSRPPVGAGRSIQS